MDLVTIFVTGLLTGGLTCIAVQGGLLAASIAQHSIETHKRVEKQGHALPLLVFVLAKLIAYTLLGFLLGWLGSVMKLSLTASVILQFLVVFFMLGTALHLLNVHPIFRYFVIQPPRFLTKFLRRESRSASVFAPAVLGASTVFIPCGTTQAMMALAVATGNPFLGATVLFVFTLGTSPFFFILGYLATRLGLFFQKAFRRIAAAALILLALYNLNGAIALTGSPWTLSSVAQQFICIFAYCGSEGFSQPVNEATITITNDGYTPNKLAVKAGSVVTLHLQNKGGNGCTQALTIPQLNIQKIVPLGASDTLTFTAPDKPGSKLAFMCSMGMYPGVIDII